MPHCQAYVRARPGAFWAGAAAARAASARPAQAQRAGAKGLVMVGIEGARERAIVARNGEIGQSCIGRAADSPEPRVSERDPGFEKVCWRVA